MAAPFTIQGTLALPGAPGLPAEPLPFGVVSQYDSKSEFEYVFPDTPSGSKSVDFGTTAAEGAKLLLVVYNYAGDVSASVASSADPILLTLNGSADPVEVSSGGFLALASPSPSVGITSVSIAYTSAGKVRVWLLG